MSLQQVSAVNNNMANLVQLCFNNQYATKILLFFSWIQIIIMVYFNITINVK